MIYSIPYILVSLILLFLYRIEQDKINKNKSPLVVRRFAFCILLFFLGFRGHLASDFISYYPYYETLPTIVTCLKSLGDSFFEPGFVIYSSVIKTFGIDYFGWVIINTAIDLFVLQWFFRKYSSSAILPFIFFMAFNGLLVELNLYRNMKGLDLFLLSYPFLQQRKFLPYFVLNLIGYTFHSSSLLYIPLYFILNKDFNKYVMWGGVILVNILYFSGFSLTNHIIEYLEFSEYIYDKVSGYVSRDTEYGFSLGYFERTITILLFLFNYDKLKEVNLINVSLINCAFIYYTTFYLFSDSSILVDRVPALFLFADWTLMGILIKLGGKYRQLICTYVFLMAFMKLSVSTKGLPFKYDNILWGIESYEKRKTIYLNSAE